MPPAPADRPTPLVMPATRAPSTARQRLSDEAPVIRGGTLSQGTLLRAVQVTLVELGRPGLSVAAADAESPGEVLRASKIPHPVISCSTVGRLREAGFTLEQTGTAPHHTIWMPGHEDPEEVLARLVACFDEPVARGSL